MRDLALFNLAIDSKLRGCDLVSLRVCDISQEKIIYPRAIVMQRKTYRPVQFEITELTRQSVAAWIDLARLASDAYLFPSRVTKSPLIYRRTKSLRAIQLLLGHTKLESTVRYLGIEVDDALEMAEQTET